MNKNTLQEPKKINLIKNRQNAKTVEALTHTHTRYVYKIKENSKRLNIKNRIEVKKLNVINKAENKKVNIKSKARIFDATNFAKKSLLCVQKIDRNISLKLMEVEPLDTS